MLDLAFEHILATYEKGQFGEAVRLAKDYARQNPKNERAHYILGLSAFKSNDLEQAEKSVKTGLKINCDNATTVALMWNLYGQIAEAQTRYAMAEKYYQKALVYDGSKSLFRYRLGKFYERRGNTDAAFEVYSETLKRSPTFVPARNELGLLALDDEDFETAEYHFTTALEQDKNYYPAWQNLLHVRLQNADDPDAAVACGKEALRLKPNRETNISMGEIYGALGRAQDAAGHYHKALALDDGRFIGNIWLSISRYDAHEKHLPMIDEAISRTPVQTQKALLCFAKASIYESQKDYAQAEAHYLHANALHYETIKDDAKGGMAKLRAEVQATKAVFADVDLTGSAKVGDEAGYEKSPGDIFIVGTMRCGSSLLEQMLTCHSEIGGAGEIGHLTYALEVGGDKINDPQKILARLSDDAAKKESADIYHRRIGYFLRDQKLAYITNKFLHNFLYIGWIRLLLPSAKIILCRRRAEDRALSIFCNYFTSAQHFYAYDMEKLAEFFAIYEEITDFWCDKCGDTLYQLHYENLVAEPQETLQSVMDYLQLQPQDSMLNFAESRRAVQTASNMQVRSGLYKSSVGKMSRFPKVQELWQAAEKTNKNN